MRYKSKAGGKTANVSWRYKELEAGAKFGKMPHEFLTAPRWSRIAAMAYVAASQKLENYLTPDPPKKGQGK